MCIRDRYRKFLAVRRNQLRKAIQYLLIRYEAVRIAHICMTDRHQFDKTDDIRLLSRQFDEIRKFVIVESSQSHQMCIRDSLLYSRL